MPQLVEAFVQDVKNGPYLKIFYVSEESDASVHMDMLRREYAFHQVLSVKLLPADERTLEEFHWDQHGNMPVVDGVIVASEAIIDDTETDSNSG